MLALILAMIFCVAIGAGVVGWVMLEARREGRGEFWTPEGEELIAGARRTGEKVRTRGEQIGRNAAVRTRDLAARRPERSTPESREDTMSEGRPGSTPEGRPEQAGREHRPRSAEDADDRFRAAS